MECVCCPDERVFGGSFEDQFQPGYNGFGMIQKYDRTIFPVIPDLVPDFLNGLIC